ncbi:hypothetical protein [Streptomyces sp. NRRL S-87]|uniref:hypothetical protein n=1 Tax=Streptomyces sp. NRRL S-87 TaxID=1463920 RepID=UPI0004BF7298|nr:hypothetical protein [Streptomyces sp. NRRL S-87]
MRKALALLAVPALAVMLSACSSEGRTAEETARAYVAALNDRDPDALVDLSKEDKRVTGREKDAEAIITKDGGRGLKVTGIAVDSPTSPEYAHVYITGTDKAGKPFKLTIDVTREGDATDYTISLGHYKEGEAPTGPVPIQ